MCRDICRRRILVILACTSAFLASSALFGESRLGTEVTADALVQQLRDSPPYLYAGPISVLCAKSSPCEPPPLPPAEAKRRQIYDQLYALGSESVPSLARALQSSDVGLRRNVILVLGVLAGGWYFSDRSPPKIDIRAALPALITALRDSDLTVRAWAAEDIGDVGPGAVEAVPQLVALLSDTDEGVRNDACLGLKGIGPVAKGALPALRQALSDPSPDVQRFAQFAIASIEERLKSAEHR
jgi:hypothetical protein